MIGRMINYNSFSNMKERSAADFTNETRALRTYKTKQFSLEDLKANSKYYFRIRYVIMCFSRESSLN